MTSNKGSLYFLITSMMSGGAERQVSYLLDVFPDSKVICFESDNDYNIPTERIILLGGSKLSAMKRFLYIPSYVWKIRNIIKQNPNSTVVSLMDVPNIVNFFVHLVTNTKAIFSVRNTLSEHYDHKTKRPKLFLFFLMYIYKRTKSIVVNSKGSKEDLVKMGILDKNITVINNMYKVEEIRNAIRNANYPEWESILSNPSIVITGRFDIQKGHSYFIDVFAKLKSKIPNIKLILIGKGELKESLITQARSNNLLIYDWKLDALNDSYDVYFAGHQSNPYWFSNKASMFVLPSLYEGLPNVLIESLISGAVCVAADCHSGPREILAADTDSLTALNQPEYTPFGVLMPPFNRKADNNTTENVENIWVETIENILHDSEIQLSLRKKAFECGMRYDINILNKHWKAIIEN